MEVNDAMVNKLASLAKLRFDAGEQEAIKTDLERMISFVRKMDEVDTADVEPCSTWQSTGMHGGKTR